MGSFTATSSIFTTSVVTFSFLYVSGCWAVASGTRGGRLDIPSIELLKDVVRRPSSTGFPLEKSPSVASIVA